MDLSWILLGLIGWALGLLLILFLVRMGGVRDRAARYRQKRLDPFSDVTITKAGGPPEARSSTAPVSDCADRQRRP